MKQPITRRYHETKINTGLGVTDIVVASINAVVNVRINEDAYLVRIGTANGDELIQRPLIVVR